MENLFKQIDTLITQRVMSGPVRGDLKTAMIAAKDVARFAADCMDRKNFLGKTVRELLGQRDLTMEEAAAIIGRKIGKPNLKYVTLTYPDAHKKIVAAGFSAVVMKAL